MSLIFDDALSTLQRKKAGECEKGSIILQTCYYCYQNSNKNTLIWSNQVQRL